VHLENGPVEAKSTSRPVPGQQVTMTALSPSRQRLVRLMRTFQFCEIRDLALSRGEPQFDPPPLVIRTVKLDTAHCSGRVPTNDGFIVKQQIVEMFAHFDRIGDGSIDCLLVQHGLPCRMAFAVPALQQAEVEP
jgi:hypothetical protein